MHINEKVCRSSEVLVIERGNVDTCIVYDKRRKRAYQFGRNECQILKDIDGEKTVEEIAKLNKVYKDTEIERLVNIFNEMDLLKGKHQKKKVNILKMKFALWNPPEGIQKCGRFLCILYYLVIALAIPLFVLGVLLNNMSEVYTYVIQNIKVSYIIFSAIFTVFSVSIHELAHAVAARKNGGVVVEIGVMLYYFFPCAYTSICGVRDIKNISKRVIITLAGMITNIFVMGVTLILFSCVQSDMLKDILTCNLIANFIPVVSNLNIFFKFDLYYALALILNKPHLREEAVQYYKGIFNKRKIQNGKKDSAVITYGILMIINLYAVPLVLLSYITELASLLMEVKDFFIKL